MCTVLRLVPAAAGTGSAPIPGSARTARPGSALCVPAAAAAGSGEPLPQAPQLPGSVRLFYLCSSTETVSTNHYLGPDRAVPCLPLPHISQPRSTKGPCSAWGSLSAPFPNTSEDFRLHPAAAAKIRTYLQPSQQFPISVNACRDFWI